MVIAASILPNPDDQVWKIFFPVIHQSTYDEYKTDVKGEDIDQMIELGEE